jgi:hypothetical protein
LNQSVDDTATLTTNNSVKKTGKVTKAQAATNAATNVTQSVPKRRGRPPKNAAPKVEPTEPTNTDDQQKQDQYKVYNRGPTGAIRRTNGMPLTRSNSINVPSSTVSITNPPPTDSIPNATYSQVTSQNLYKTFTNNNNSTATATSTQVTAKSCTINNNNKSTVKLLMTKCNSSSNLQRNKVSVSAATNEKNVNHQVRCQDENINHKTAANLNSNQNIFYPQQNPGFPHNHHQLHLHQEHQSYLINNNQYYHQQQHNLHYQHKLENITNKTPTPSLVNSSKFLN